MFTQNRKTVQPVDKWMDELIHDYRALMDIAERLKQLYALLDEHKHELGRTAWHYENRFRERYENVYGSDLRRTGDFKLAVENACRDAKKT